MIEAMACGTPVLAFRCGSIPEVIEDGVTGKVVDSEEDALAALPGDRSTTAVRCGNGLIPCHGHENGQRLCQRLSSVVKDA